MVDLRPFKEGIEAARAKADVVYHDPRSAFLDLLSKQGFKCKAITVGKLERVDGPEDKPGQKSGWYIYREIGSTGDGAASVIGVGIYGCWKAGFSEKWISHAEHRMTTQERLAYFAAREEMQAQVEQETKAKQIEAAKLAFNAWQAAKPAGNDNAYLKRKGVRPSAGVKELDDGRLLIPVCDNGHIISTQTIMADGTKRFLSGGRTKGGYFVIEGDENKVYVAEGYATAASIHEATKATCYIAFSCHNLYEVAEAAQSERPCAQIVIAGDNGNGSKSAQQAGDTLGLDVIFPPDPDLSDFNDYHAGHGIEALKKFLGKGDKKVYEKKQDESGFDLEPCAGVIKDLFNYYNATSGNNQPGFALQTALGIASVLCGRSFSSDYQNFTCLYLLNVGKSATGKEHIKKTTERVLAACNMPHLIGGDGYTSSGAVFTMLMHRPRHISVIDEFGRYLEAGRDMKGGNHNQREANTKIMEAFGRADGVMRPQTYSAMTQKKEVAEQNMNRAIHNPSITLMAMTTPETLYKTLSMDAVKDGFINRFLICQSKAERSIRKHKPMLDVPIRIVDWAERISLRHGGDHIYNEPPNIVVLPFTQESVRAQEEFQDFCFKKMDELDRFNMAEIAGRSNEIAMRIALIAALSESPEATEIELRHMRWAIGYVKKYLLETIDALKNAISATDYEGHKKEILAALRDAGEDGATWSQMQKNAPYSKHKAKDLREILRALIDADLAAEESYTSPKGGRPTTKYTALG